MAVWSDLSNVPFAKIERGASATLTRTLSQTDIEILALISGDVDSFHWDSTNTPPPKPDSRSTESAGAEALIAAVIGTKLPGPGSRISRQNLTYHGSITVGDRLTATIIVKEKDPATHEVSFSCCCVNDRNEELVSGTVTVIAPTERITYTDLTPPELTLRRQDAFAALFQSCHELAPVRCAVVYPCDHDSLAGPLQAAARGLIEPVLVGPVDKINAVAAAAGMDIRAYDVVPTTHGHAAAVKAVEMARAGQVEALMKGSLHTDELMAAVVPSATGLRTARRISHVFVMDVPSYSRQLLISDAAINIYPKLEEKVDIVQNAIDLAQVLGIARPNVAILSAVETVTSKITSTLDAAALCKMADRGQITGGCLDGPLAFDNAISLQAAQTKKISSPVAGQADVLIVPDLEAGNMLAKQLCYLAGAEGAGIILGTSVPIVLTSRADSVRTRLASTAVLALFAHARRRTGTSLLR